MNDEMTLSSVSSGVSVRVLRLDPGEGARQKILSLGIRPGSELKVQSYNKNGPLVIRLDGSRIALGRGLAERIYVEVVD